MSRATASSARWNVRPSLCKSEALSEGLRPNNDSSRVSDDRHILSLFRSETRRGEVRVCGIVGLVSQSPLFECQLDRAVAFIPGPQLNFFKTASSSSRSCSPVGLVCKVIFSNGFEEQLASLFVNSIAVKPAGLLALGKLAW